MSLLKTPDHFHQHFTPIISLVLLKISDNQIMKNSKILKYTGIVFLLLNINYALAMGAKKPQPAPSPAPLPPPSENTPPPSKPIDPIGSKLPIDNYKEVASIIGFNVDKVKNSNELSESRQLINEDQVDSCMSDRIDSTQFSETISFFVQEMLDDTPSRVGNISGYFGLSSNEAGHYPSSLIRHPLCYVSKSSLSTTLGKKIPSDAIILKLNQFSARINELREKTINGDTESKAQLHKEWSTLFSCLGYVESLTTANSPKSQTVSKKYAPENYRKPAGVKFYEDPYQSESSRLNIGIFQFTPNSTGNIQSCLRAWNTMYPQCSLRTTSTQSELIKTLGSSLQSFNAFCGVHKLIQTYSIQINTNKSSATHPSNTQDGKIKKPMDRCVSPHFAAGKAYNHFGPFQNSTGTNLGELISCIEKSRDL